MQVTYYVNSFKYKVVLTMNREHCTLHSEELESFKTLDSTARQLFICRYATCVTGAREGKKGCLFQALGVLKSEDS